jgi:hypothetical protein
VAVPRYALAGLPAAFLLVGLGISRLPFRPRVAFLTLIMLAWLIGIRRMYLNDTRHFEPVRLMGQLLAARTGPSELVIVHSIPSVVAGVARYLEGQGVAAGGPGFASWVGQLRERRVPESLQSLAAGRRRIILVKIHEAGEPAPEEDWLREHAKLVDEYKRQSATVLTFVPLGAERFFVRGPTLPTTP